MVRTCYRFSRLSVCSHSSTLSFLQSWSVSFSGSLAYNKRSPVSEARCGFPVRFLPTRWIAVPAIGFISPSTLIIPLDFSKYFSGATPLMLCLSASGLGACTRGYPFGTHPVIRLQPSVPADFLMLKNFSGSSTH